LGNGIDLAVTEVQPQFAAGFHGCGAGNWLSGGRRHQHVAAPEEGHWGCRLKTWAEAGEMGMRFSKRGSQWALGDATQHAISPTT